MRSKPMMISRKSLPRRTFLKGVGAALSLPLLDAMIPAATATVKTAAAPVKRLGFVFMPIALRSRLVGEYGRLWVRLSLGG